MTAVLLHLRAASALVVTVREIFVRPCWTEWAGVVLLALGFVGPLILRLLLLASFVLRAILLLLHVVLPRRFGSML